MFQDNIISFIGAGVMGEAMIRGLLVKKMINPDQIIAADPWKERLLELHDQHGIRTTSNNAEAAEEGQVIVLSIKPQSLSIVMRNNFV